MRIIVMSLLVLICHTGYAHTLYSRMSECEPNLSINGKEFRATVNSKRSESKDDQINKVRQKLYRIISQQLNDYPNGLIEQSVLFTNNSQTKQVTGTVAVKHVKRCTGKTYHITQDSLELLTAIVNKNDFPAIKFTTEYTFTPSLPEEIKPIDVDGKITHNSVFGVPLGATYEEARTKLERFSLQWPINDNLFIALIGRNHLFIFENDIFKGYQYHHSLLPMSLANQLELVTLDIELLANDAIFSTKMLLAENQKNTLKKAYPTVAFQTMHSDNETSFSKIESVQVGKLAEINQLKSIPCYKDNTSFNQFLTQQKEKLVSFIDVNDKRSLLTGCLQKFTLTGNNKLKEIILLDEIGNGQNNAKTINTLVSSLKPWTLDKVKYGQTASELLALGATLEWQQALLETPQWHGIFEMYDDVIYAGKIIPLALD